jgi:hypothetical protein
MHIDWASLTAVAVAAAAAALAVVLLVALAVVALSIRSDPGGDGPDRGQASRIHPEVGAAVAGLCVLAAGLIVCYGLYLLIA